MAGEYALVDASGSQYSVKPLLGRDQWTWRVVTSDGLTAFGTTDERVDALNAARAVYGVLTHEDRILNLLQEQYG